MPPRKPCWFTEPPDLPRATNRTDTPQAACKGTAAGGVETAAPWRASGRLALRDRSNVKERWLSPTALWLHFQRTKQQPLSGLSYTQAPRPCHHLQNLYCPRGEL